jgi:hypothetical protein
MKLKNSTDWPDHFLRRMVSWCCKELDIPVRTIKEAVFRNRSHNFSGHAYPWRKRIVVSCAAQLVPVPPNHERKYHKLGFEDAVDCLVAVAGHEIYHVAAEHVPEHKQRSRRFGRSAGSSEKATCHAEYKVQAAFRAQRESLLAAWSEPTTKDLTVKPKASTVERRAAKAATDLARWERKLKLAKTKVATYRRRVRYYEKRSTAATKSN